MTRVSISTEALGDFAIRANHKGGGRSVNTCSWQKAVALAFFLEDIRGKPLQIRKWEVERRKRLKLESGKAKLEKEAEVTEVTLFFSPGF
jgi:hypothetical protein